MARALGIKKRLESNGFDETVVKSVIGNKYLIGVIERLEKTVEPELVHEMLDSCGCGGGKDFHKFCVNIGKENSGKSMADKVAYVNETSSSSENVILNADNTLTVTWSFDGAKKYNCLCPAAVKTGMRVSDIALSDDLVMPLTYCFCCAGSGRRHLELKLGVELKTKTILSSPINSHGEKPCIVVLEVVSPNA